MARVNHRRVVRVPKQENELHVFSNPLSERDQNESTSLVRSSSFSSQRQPLSEHDYEAPLTAHSLRPNSSWLIVRRNLHRIRFMGYRTTGKQDRAPDIYLGIQMTRELKRAQEEIKNIDKQENFRVAKHFLLASEAGRPKRFDISHVKPDDALIYDRLGEEPLSLQNLLYYFSKKDVQHGTMFWDFLKEVNLVLSLKRKRTVLVQRLRQLALTLAVIIFSLIGIMFFLMVISVITTATKMNDPEVKWMDQKTREYSSNLLSL
jgi:hypothetical protein